MKSPLVDALQLSWSPVAVILSDTAPEGALRFKEGRWGCVGSTMTAVAKGRTAVFDRATFGCPGGGVGLGFGDQDGLVQPQGNGDLGAGGVKELHPAGFFEKICVHAHFSFLN